MRNLLIIALSLVFICCSKSDDDDAMPTPMPPDPDPIPPTELPDWLLIENEDLGTVTVSNIPDDSNAKSTITFEVSGNSDDVNWLFLHNDTEKGNNWQGDLLMVPATDTINVIFVDGPIDLNIPNTNIYHRYNFEWVSDSYTQDYIVAAVALARERIAASNAEELVPIFDESEIHLYFDGASAGVGNYINESKIVMNTVNNFDTPLQYASQIIHEYGHLYHVRNPEVESRQLEIFNNATWTDPDAYYAISDAEMFACALSHYIVNNSRGDHNIASEAYFTSTILPFLIELFENN